MHVSVAFEWASSASRSAPLARAEKSITATGRKVHPKVGLHPHAGASGRQRGL